MHEVLREEEAQVPADRAGRRAARVGGANHRARDLPRVIRTFDDHRHDRPGRNEGFQVFVESFCDVFGVVLLAQLRRHLQHLHADQAQALAFNS